MGKAGILTSVDRVELIDGEIVLMPAMLSRRGGSEQQLLCSPPRR